MGKLLAFNFVTLNGFFKGPNGDISWHKDNDKEKDDYAKQGMKAGSTLLFGRVTYEMMIRFWPTENAKKFMPEMAAGMNKADKIVFSKTLKKADWENTKIIKSNIFEEVRKMKEEGKDLTILGSGTIITQFAEQGLIDEFQFMVDPIAIPDGTPTFKNISFALDLQLVEARSMKSGVVILTYKPLKK